MIERYEQFSFIVSVINRQIQKLERDAMVKHGYKGAFAQYLMIMRHYPEGITSARLCELCDKDKAAVSRVVAEMAEKGLIARIASGESMYRARLVLTEEGYRIADYIAQRAMEVVSAVDNGLTEDGRKQFYSTLDAIASKLQLISEESTNHN